MQNVGGVVLRCVLADDAIDQSAGTGPEQIDFDERILLLENVDELLALGDGDRRVPGNPPFTDARYYINSSAAAMTLSSDGKNGRSSQ